jgi:hypothetical protein
MKIKLFLWSVCLISATFVGCSKWDDYKQYTNNGEQIYSGKLDSVKVFPGRNRVSISGLLPADPKIKRLKVTWNDGRDSILYDIVKTSKVDTVVRLLNVVEGIYNFKFQTFDAAGNKSMISTATGMALGTKYETGLVNRPISNAEILSNGSAEIRWGTLDTSTGAKGSWVKFSKANNLPDSLYVPVGEAISLIPNFKVGSSVMVRTLYRPTNSVDDFFASWQTVNVMYDVTTTYIKNPGINFSNSEGGTDRWQTPASWIATADVKNGGNNIGGLDNGSWLPSKALSIEAGFGLPAVTNGKLYQTFILPAGRYTFIATAGDCSSGGTKYLSIAPGTSLPDIESVQATAIVYKLIEKFTDNKLSFTLNKDTQVSIGMQAAMNADGNFMKVFKVKLLYSGL